MLVKNKPIGTQFTKQALPATGLTYIMNKLGAWLQPHEYVNTPLAPDSMTLAGLSLLP
jgi:hypothetical protein